MKPPGISIVAAGPLWRPSTDTWHLTHQISNYTHTLEAVGGYWSAQFTIQGGRHLIDDWLQDGLGRHIEVFDDTLTKCWEGFVDRLTVNYGPLSVVRGPLMDVANRVGLAYSTVDTSTDPPTVGIRDWTGYVNDTDSQALWGILPKVLSTGGVTPPDAAAIQNTYLTLHALPATSKQLQTDAGSETSVTVDCFGYVHWLNWPYNSTTTGEIDADAKILDVLGDTPNAAWLVYNTDHVDANTLEVPAYEIDLNLAWAVIKDVVARGDATYARWLFGIYGNREVFYHAAPTMVEYQERLSQSRSLIEHADGDQVYEVYPWRVVPGQWIIFPDFLIGQATELDLHDDPRAMFIERVKYNAPWGLELNGSTVDTLDALLAQKGLGGVGA